MKLWGGRFTQETDKLVEAYTASIRFDQRLAGVDIEGSIAHAQMLGRTGILTAAEADQLVAGLAALRADVVAGNVHFRPEDEDIHMNVERLLRDRIGAVAGKLHTGRSRNDQVALDMHMYVRDAVADVIQATTEVQGAILQCAQAHLDVVIPGYTHLQRAQPVLFSHHLLAYFWMFQRDVQRFEGVKGRADMMPLGAGALAGTTFPVDRAYVAQQLGFTQLYENSMDAVSDRDYILEFQADASILMMHLSRLAEEFVLWCSAEYGWLELADAYCTGSSMMPQKKNPDVAELVRGKTGRVYGHLMALLTVLKGLPMAYNKDLQEDKEGLFDTVDTVLPALKLFAGMIRTLELRRERLAAAFDGDFSNATDLADYLVSRGVAFREAHAIVGRLVLIALSAGTNLTGLPFSVYEDASPQFQRDVYAALSIQRVVDARNVSGGTARTAVEVQLKKAMAAWAGNAM